MDDLPSEISEISELLSDMDFQNEAEQQNKEIQNLINFKFKKLEAMKAGKENVILHIGDLEDDSGPEIEGPVEVQAPIGVAVPIDPKQKMNDYLEQFKTIIVMESEVVPQKEISINQENNLELLID